MNAVRIGHRNSVLRGNGDVFKGDVTQGHLRQTLQHNGILSTAAKDVLKMNVAELGGGFGDGRNISILVTGGFSRRGLAPVIEVKINRVPRNVDHADIGN